MLSSSRYKLVSAFQTKVLHHSPCVTISPVAWRLPYSVRGDLAIWRFVGGPVVGDCISLAYIGCYLVVWNLWYGKGRRAKDSFWGRLLYSYPIQRLNMYRPTRYPPASIPFYAHQLYSFAFLFLHHPTSTVYPGQNHRSRNIPVRKLITGGSLGPQTNYFHWTFQQIPSKDLHEKSLYSDMSHVAKRLVGR